MSLQLLRRLAGEALPVTITDPSEVETVRVLRASGHLLCLMFTDPLKRRAARVLTLTAEGRHALALSVVEPPAANDAALHRRA